MIDHSRRNPDACKLDYIVNVRVFPLTPIVRKFVNMESSDTALSLIISTRNRSSSLTRTLESLRKLRTCLSWELVIIDNGSSDDTQLIIERFVATFSGTVQLVSEPKRGLGQCT